MGWASEELASIDLGDTRRDRRAPGARLRAVSGGGMAHRPTDASGAYRARPGGVAVV